jgi:hypothetical protein
MRALSSLALIFVLLSKTAYGLFWQVNFHLNQKEIIRMECENKDKPEMNCNGKCYLAKQLQKAEAKLEVKKQESTRSLEQLKWLETAVFATPDFPKVHEVAIFTDLQKQSYSMYLECFPTRYIPSVFHPPCSLAALHKSV